MSNVGTPDPFGRLADVPAGLSVPEFTAARWDRREKVDKTLPWVQTLLRASGLVEWFEEHIAEEKKRLKPTTKAGRTRDVTVEAVLVGWLMCKMTRRSLLHTEVARFLLHTISDAQREALGVPVVTADPTKTSESDAARGLMDKQAVAKRIGRLVKQMMALVDPSDLDQPRKRIKVAEAESLRRDVTPEELAVARERLDWVVLQLTTMPVRGMPRWMRRQWTGDGAVDDTHVRLASRKPSSRVPWDVDGGLYVRAKATGDRHAPKTAGGKGTKVMQVTKAEFALDLALVIACDATPGDRQYFPSIPLGFAAHRPSTDPAGNSKRVFDLLAGAGVKKRYMAADRLYPHQDPGKFHVPLAEQGWTTVFDYRVDTLGRQGIVKGGVLVVEGGCHCPMTPETAIEATADLRAKKIDAATWEARMAERNLYRLHQKETADANGTIRVGCPALGDAPKVRCPLREKSLQPHIIRQPDGTPGDHRPLVQLLPTRFADVAEAEALAADKKPREVKAARAEARKPLEPGDNRLPKVCRNSDSVSVRRTEAVKFRQDLVYGSKKHADVHRAARNAQEGLHGFAKDDANEAIGNPGLRLKRGFAAQSLYAAVGLAVASIRKIVSFMENMRQDEQGRWYVPRKARTGQVAFGEDGGYGDPDDEDNWVPADDDGPPETGTYLPA